MRLNQKSRKFRLLLSGAIIPHSHLKHEEENGERWWPTSSSPPSPHPLFYRAALRICADISLLLLLFSSIQGEGRGGGKRPPKGRGGRLIQSGHIYDDDEEEEEEEEKEEIDMVQSASQTGTRFVVCAMSLFYIGVRRRGITTNSFS